MSENRKQILEMLSQGRITPEEAEQLILALEKTNVNFQVPARKPAPKYLRVVVKTKEGFKTQGPSEVNIRVPIQFLRAGIKLASLIPAHARAHINSALHVNGVEIDIGQLKPENLQELIDHLNELTIDVNERNHKVHIFCE